MKQLLLVPVLLGTLALPGLADSTATAPAAPNKVTITPAPGSTEANAVATVTTEPAAGPQQSRTAPDLSAIGEGGRGCHGSRKTQALIN
jgi:hypothetical protein